MLPPTEQALSQLLAREEEERRALQAQRGRLQEAALQEAHSRLHQAQGELRSLREDFVHNLQVLEERDHELERYDAAFARARGLEEAQRAEVSELRVEAARLRQALALEARRREDLLRQHRLTLQEHRRELERVHRCTSKHRCEVSPATVVLWTTLFPEDGPVQGEAAEGNKKSEMDQQREQYGSLNRQLERKLAELHGELAQQRQELLLEFKSEMQKREHGFRQQADSLSTVVSTHELKVKVLNEELAAVKEAATQAAESLRSAEAAGAGLEDELRRRDRELRDVAAAKDARIKDLEDRLNCVQLSRKKEEEVARRKHEELDRLARERDAALAAAKGAHAEQLQALEARARELQAHCEALELQLRRAEWRQGDTLREKDAALDRLREDALALRSGWDAQIAELSKEMISKDLQIQSLQAEAVELKAHLARCQQDIGRYKQQLSAAEERQRGLEREKAQLELDWRQRCDVVERDHYRKAEDLIRALSEARDQASAKLQETERTLRDQEGVLKALTLERDQAVQALRTRGLLPEKEVRVLLGQQEEEIRASFPSSEMQRLQEQNTSLRRAVAEMRKEMEALSDHVPPPAPSGARAADTEQPRPSPEAAAEAPDHITVLETEIRNLKHKFKALEEQLEVFDPSKTSSSYADFQPSVHASAHVPETLLSWHKDEISSPTALSAGGDWPFHSAPELTSRWTRGAVPAEGAPVGLALRRLRNRAHVVNLLVARLRQKVLQRPLDVDTVQHALPREVDQVRQQVSELRKQVFELEEHLGNRPLLPALDKVALGRERPTATEDQGPQRPQALSVPRLQRKLKEATRKILRLCLEKEQLLEMGNRLRAELGHRAPGGAAPHRPPGPGVQNRSVTREAPSGQLQPRFAAQDSENTRKTRVSEYSGKVQPRLAQTAGRSQPPQGQAAGAVTRSGQRQHRMSAATCRCPRHKENQSPKLRPAHEGPTESRCLAGSSSSVASGPLQDTWKLLDLGSSPSGLTSQDDSAPERTARPAADSLRHPDGSSAATRAAFAVEGMKMEARAKALPARPARAPPSKTKGCQQPPKIRNYNLKD
ncbi:coiled-coil domain-containing protein 57 isoform X1 [Mustela erminea]|uniref:coiled-coil domain-containing protein 57 isoform X1 n=2 Tax=Mustela erminea TaxID=36723 RepID=UPI00138683BA|nr:coiled-coil domain-containing protein 57 isoform X1 [Mustela erminea]XP_032178000.1 coiled-coil domain-containing protein 57 isoform X1 [Mustela erminea]XP_032178001.1 coiled-coil domain-containing protein 57 isoform X1 [Mustela erminea]XP_032178002.1 coiled-coil domain-containing protein 57 isoform X1 [Mustela erminea]XP_032178003.1 coiled-coil domain-containing protein 57 isoform X1 [Mustela erminea]XP_032178004.1 coiled-coil domain-containing protein 57 isoform X1 [Mustela erminea]